MSVRTVPKSYRNVTGVVAQTKAEDKAMFESTLERDFITLLEFDNQVVSYDVQPVKIEWLDKDGKSRSYTPDILYKKKVKGKIQTFLVEVKYRTDIKENWDTLKPKFIAAIRYAKSQGYRFKLMSEVEIRTDYLTNARFLNPFINRGADYEGDMTLIDEKLKELKQSTPALLLSELASSDWDKAALLPTLWYLIGTNQIKCDLSSKLNMNTPISWKP